MANQSPESKEVKCSYEWNASGNTHSSPKFSSHHVDGVKLEWRLELISFGKNSKEFFLGLCLLTDIEDEIDLSYSFSIAKINGTVLIPETKGKKNLNENRMSGWFKIKDIDLNSSPWKITIKLSYKEAILESCSGGMQSQNYNVDEKCITELSENFGNLLRDRKFTDVTLIVKGKEFKAHKLILSARSPVLAAAILEQEKLEIEDLEPDTVQELLKFIYTGRVPKLGKMAQELLIASDRYKMETLKKMAESSLIRSVSVANASNLLLLADKHSALKLKTKAVEFIADNVEELENTEEWKNVMENHPRLLVPILSEVVKKGRKGPETD